jgi:hypothetical protein
VGSFDNKYRDLGFRWRKSESRKVLAEKYDIRAARPAYLRNINRYRNEGRPDETFMMENSVEQKLCKMFSSHRR